MHICYRYTIFDHPLISFHMIVILYYESYHLMICFRKLIYKLFANDLVKISTTWSIVEIGNSCIILLRTLMCFVRGRILCIFANSKAPILSSKDLQYTVGTVLTNSKLRSFISFSRFITGITSLSDWYRLTYSASLVLSAIWVYNFDDQTVGWLVYMTINPVRDFVVLTSNLDVIFV